MKISSGLHRQCVVMNCISCVEFQSFVISSSGARTMKAIWNNTLIAESNETVKLEGNYYFPPDSVMTQFLRASSTHTICSWKGKASYFDIVIDDSINRDAAWYYPEPKQEALNIKNYVAFWHGVEVSQ